MNNIPIEDTIINNKISELKELFLHNAKHLLQDKPNIYSIWNEYIKLYFKKMQHLNTKLRETINTSSVDVNNKQILLLYLLHNTILHE